MVANHTGGTNHHACAMVDAEMLAYLRGRVYVDTCGRMCHLGDDTRNNGNALQMKLMCGAIVNHHLYHRIAKYYLLHRLYSGIVVHHSESIGVKQPRNFGQRLHKVVRHFIRIGDGGDGGKLVGEHCVNGLIAIGPRRHIGIVGKNNITDQFHQSLELGNRGCFHLSYSNKEVDK